MRSLVTAAKGGRGSLGCGLGREKNRSAQRSFSRRGKTGSEKRQRFALCKLLLICKHHVHLYQRKRNTLLKLLFGCSFNNVFIFDFKSSLDFPQQHLKNLCNLSQFQVSPAGGLSEFPFDSALQESKPTRNYSDAEIRVSTQLSISQQQCMLGNPPSHRLLLYYYD